MCKPSNGSSTPKGQKHPHQKEERPRLGEVHTPRTAGMAHHKVHGKDACTSEFRRGNHGICRSCLLVEGAQNAFIPQSEPKHRPE